MIRGKWQKQFASIKEMHAKIETIVFFFKRIQSLKLWYLEILIRVGVLELSSHFFFNYSFISTDPLLFHLLKFYSSI